jgi:drug/metabolite transporter (DMT)-like permease
MTEKYRPMAGQAAVAHQRAVALMVLITLLWSLAGVVTRHLDAARSFEVTFWRSLFNALALAAGLTALRGTSFWVGLRRARWPLWLSGACWAVMFTAFMVAITLTTVANVLVTMAIGPLVTALFARLLLRHALPGRTWLAIVVAGLGIAWMFGAEARGGAALLGTVVALAVPVAGAANWTVLQSVARMSDGQDGPDMLPAVLIGAALSALATLPWAYPLRASPHDLGLLALLGVVQLGIPCLLVVRVSRILPAPEIALLALLEVVFGVAWVWLGANERPSSGTLIGGLLVLAALVANEVMNWPAGVAIRVSPDRREK